MSMKTMIPAFVLAAFGLVLIGCSGDGIINAPSNAAVYLQGEACVVNTPEGRTMAEIEADLEFCLHQAAYERCTVEQPCAL